MAKDVKDTGIIANVRINVEGVIGNLKKKDSILNGILQICYLSSSGGGMEKLKVIHTGCALINLFPSVVPVK